MRKIDEIIIHCSATKEGVDFRASDVDRWHRQRGFKCIGYHYFIRLDGTVEKGRDESMVGAHCQGHNAHSIGICYCGGLDKNGKAKDTRTIPQKAALWKLICDLRDKYGYIPVVGHNFYNKGKACPCFQPEEEYNEQ